LLQISHDGIGSSEMALTTNKGRARSKFTQRQTESRSVCIGARGVGTRTWGRVAVPEWALRYLPIRHLITEYSDDDEVEEAVCYFSSSDLVRDDVIPEEIHRTLQALEVPYDVKYCESGEVGIRSGGWRPGMQRPVEFWVDPGGERLFTLREIRGALENLTSPDDQIRALIGLLEDHQRALTPLEKAPDPRLDRSQALRIETQETPGRRCKQGL
jgi:hypothetical protein